MKRRLFHLVTVVALLVCGATVLVGAGKDVWIRGVRSYQEHQITHEGGISLSTWEDGSQSIGLYAHAGYFGFIAVTGGMDGLDDTELRPPVPDSTWWRASRDASDEAGYLGGIPDNLVPDSVTDGVPHGFYICNYNDAAMRHFIQVRGIMFNPWPIAAVTLLLPITAITSTARRNRRLKARRCVSCGYDLRATPTRCPECGIPNSGG